MSLQPHLLPPLEQEAWVADHLPYRIQVLRGLEIYDASGGFNSALRPVQPCIFEGTLLNCRWAAYFLGLDLQGNLLTQLAQRKRDNDVHAVDIGGTLVNPTDSADLSVAERALLASVLKGANVAAAHPVREGAHLMKDVYVGPAAKLLIKLIETHVYGVLGKPVPPWKWA
ncbi:MAG TPA: hypothetical protein VEH50_04270 [Methylomirabilota bacterium]|nr:hypothetical protein [Methylomirabilota bacterium]